MKPWTHGSRASTRAAKLLVCPSAVSIPLNCPPVQCQPSWFSTQLFLRADPCRLIRRSIFLGGKHETSTLCRTNVGPASTTLAQHWFNNGSMSRVCWDGSVIAPGMSRSRCPCDPGPAPPERRATTSPGHPSPPGLDYPSSPPPPAAHQIDLCLIH